MDSEDEDAIFDDEHEDSYNESGSEQGDESDFDIDCDEPSTPKRPHINDDFHYECLTPEALVSYMNAIIDEVNNVFQVSYKGFVGVRQTYLYINANINNTKRCPVLLGLAESNEGSCVIIRVSWVVKCYPYSKSYECLHYLSFSNAKEPRSLKYLW